MRNLFSSLARFGATLGLFGKLPAPGTFGSGIGLISGWYLLQFGLSTLVLGILIVSIIGGVAVHFYDQNTPHKDAPEIIIDELAGQWLTLLFIPQNSHIIWFLLAFGLFRLFDIGKFGLCRQVEQLPGASGIMADDLIAALQAGIGLLLVQYLFSLWG